MFKNKALVIISILVLVLAVVAMSCAPASKPATTTPPASTPSTTTPPASSTPAAPPAPPPTPTTTAPAAPAAKAASWGDSSTYSDPTTGVSFSYPKTWTTADKAGDQIFAIVASSAQGADNANVSVIASAADVGKAIKASYDSTPALAGLGVKVDVVSAKTVMLADGKTSATEVVIGAKIMGMYDLYGYDLAVTKGDKIVFVSGNTLGGGNKQALVKEIVSTMAVK